jgi:hypothetical protein
MVRSIRLALFLDPIESKGGWNSWWNKLSPNHRFEVLEYIIDFVGKIKLLGLAVISRHHRRNCRLMSALCYLQGGPKEYCPQFEINDIDLSYSLRVISNI